jgi:AbrB family looped-hinge helix DNA binding protein
MLVRRRTKMTRKGQITVPVEIRRALGLNIGDPVELTLDGGQVRLERGSSVVERTKGIFKSNLPPLTAEEMRAFAEEVWADEADPKSAR